MSSSESDGDVDSSSDDESDIYWSATSSEDELGEDEIHDPEGADSDDDAPGCCHWSTKNENQPDQISPVDGLDEFGTFSVNFDYEFAPHDVVELIIDDEFLDKCIDATNAHGADDINYMSRVGILMKNEKGRSFIKGFLAIKWHLSLIRYPNKRWAWSDDPLKAQQEIKKLMPFKTFQAMAKHFCVVCQADLPAKGTAGYHPLQNILSGVELLRQKSIALWTSGSKLCIDEGRVCSKSKRNAYKIRNPDKPIKMGWTIYKLGERGQFGRYMITNHLVKAGNKTYTSTVKGMTYNIVEQLIEAHKNQGKMLVLDSGFPTLPLIEDAKKVWNTSIVATQRGKTAHFPCRHAEFVKKAKNFARGYSKTLHKDFVTITYWNDNNAVCFFDNDIDSRQESWETMSVRNREGNEVGVHIPRVAALYRSVYGWVDRCNQQLAYYNAEFRTVRKQNRVLDSLIELYALVNSHAIWGNSNLRAKPFNESAAFRFEVIRVWFAKFKLQNARKEIAK